MAWSTEKKVRRLSWVPLDKAVAPEIELSRRHNQASNPLERYNLEHVIELQEDYERRYQKALDHHGAGRVGDIYSLEGGYVDSQSIQIRRELARDYLIKEHSSEDRESEEELVKLMGLRRRTLESMVASVQADRSVAALAGMAETQAEIKRQTEALAGHVSDIKKQVEQAKSEISQAVAGARTELDGVVAELRQVVDDLRSQPPATAGPRYHAVALPSTGPGPLRRFGRDGVRVVEEETETIVYEQRPRSPWAPVAAVLGGIALLGLGTANLVLELTERGDGAPKALIREDIRLKEDSINQEKITRRAVLGALDQARKASAAHERKDKLRDTTIVCKINEQEALERSGFNAAAKDDNNCADGHYTPSGHLGMRFNSRGRTFYVEYGNGIVTEIQQYAKTQGFGTPSSYRAFKIYQGARQQFGEDLVRTAAGADDTYVRAAGDVGISQPGQAEWSPGVESFIRSQLIN